MRISYDESGNQIIQTASVNPSWNFFKLEHVQTNPISDVLAFCAAFIIRKWTGA